MAVLWDTLAEELLSTTHQAFSKVFTNHMQRSKLSLKQESKSFQATPDNGSGGGIGGKGIFNGGGGDNDDGDGDDYFDEGDGGDEGDGEPGFFRTVVLAENYSRRALPPLQPASQPAADCCAPSNGCSRRTLPVQLHTVACCHMGARCRC